MIRFNASLLSAVAVAQSSDQARFYLCGIYFTGDLAVATNGVFLTVARDTESVIDDEGIFPVSKAAQTKAKNKKAATVEIAGGFLQVLSDTGATLHVEKCDPIDGAFPDWRRVVSMVGDNSLNPTAAKWGVSVMQCATETAKRIGSDRFRMGGEDNLSPHLIRYALRDDIYSIASPHRDVPASEIETSFPVW